MCVFDFVLFHVCELWCALVFPIRAFPPLTYEMHTNSCSGCPDRRGLCRPQVCALLVRVSLSLCVHVSLSLSLAVCVCVCVLLGCVFDLPPL